MSALDPRGLALDHTHSAPPREQRILAPSMAEVVDDRMGSPRCVCSLRITDPVNLTIYYVPCTQLMVTQLRAQLAKHDQNIKTNDAREDPTV